MTKDDNQRKAGGLSTSGQNTTAQLVDISQGFLAMRLWSSRAEQDPCLWVCMGNSVASDTKANASMICGSACLYVSSEMDEAQISIDTLLGVDKPTLLIHVASRATILPSTKVTHVQQGHTGRHQQLCSMLTWTNQLLLSCSRDHI